MSLEAVQVVLHRAIGADGVDDAIELGEFARESDKRLRIGPH